MIDVKNKDLPDTRSFSKNRCLMFVKGATSHQQGQGEPRGKPHRNYGPRSKNDLDSLAYDLGLFSLGLFSLCKRLIL